MKTLTELRNKHWRGRNTLWPRTRCASAVPFNWSTCHIRVQSFIAAQDDAHDAIQLHDEKYWNRAMYLLTDAYMGDGNWWEQWV